MLTFQYRFISLEFSGTANFRVENLRIVCRVVATMGPELSSADILIWGLTLDHINQLTTYQGAVDNCGHNTITSNSVLVLAGDADNGLRPIFDGQIMGAWPEMMNQPLGPFHIMAQAGAQATTQKEEPTSRDGEASLKDLLTEKIGKMGAIPDLGGLKDVKIQNPYLRGSVLNQITQLLQHNGASWAYQNGHFTVVTPGQNRGGSGFRVAPPYKGRDVIGLVGYPSFTNSGILVKVEYTEPIWLQDHITVESSIALANGTWNVIKADYDLESQQPGGHWFITLEGNRVC